MPGRGKSRNRSQEPAGDNNSSSLELNGRYFLSAWEQPLTMAWEQCYTSIEEVPKHKRQIYPKALVPRAWVREEDEKIDGQRIEDLRKKAAWETAEQRQELERRVGSIYEEAHARALRDAQKQ